MNKTIKFRIIELEFPFDGRRIATLNTKDKEFCEYYGMHYKDLRPFGAVGLIETRIVKEVIDKLQPPTVSDIFAKESINDKRKTFAYRLALEDLKEELGVG